MSGLLASLICLAIAQAASPWAPAKYLGGAVPPLARTVGGGEVALELTVGEDGRVTGVKALRTTPPFAGRLASQAAGWHFSPAEEERVDPAKLNEPVRVAVASKVLLLGMFRPPALRGPTLGELPQDVAAASDDVAAAITTTMPRFPPRARSGGQVLIEARVGADGVVSEVKVLEAQPPFDSAALSAFEQWTFRPARRAGVAVPSFVYVVFGFPALVGNR